MPLRAKLGIAPIAWWNDDLESLSDASVVLTADTAELRQFVLDHLETEHAFTDPFVLEKAADH